MIARLRSAGGSAMVSSLGSAVATQAFVLVTGVLAARLLGPADRGHLALIWTVTLLLSQLGSLGLPLAVTYEIAGGRATPHTMRRDVGTFVRRQIALATGIHALLLVILIATTSTPAGPALLSVAVVPASLTQSYVIAALQGVQRFHAYNILRLMSVAIYAGALVVLALIGSPDLTAVTAAWVAGWVVASMATVIAARRIFGREQTSEGPIAAASLTELRQFGLRGLLGWVSPTETLRVDQLAVGLVLSAYDLGLYVAALAITNLPRFLAQAIGSVAYPRVAAEPDMAIQRRLIWRYVSLGTAVSATVAGGLILMADPLVRLAFGDAFAGAVTPLRLLLIATIVLCTRRVLAEGMRGAGLSGATSRAELAAWISLIPALPILGLKYGLTGVASALIIAYVASLTVLLFTLGSRTPAARVQAPDRSDAPL